jgi:PAS domain S-box-containing protein
LNELALTEEILNNRLTSIIGIAIIVAIVGALFRRMEKLIKNRLHPPAPLGHEYFKLENALTALNSVAAAIIISDLNGKIIYVNEYSAKLLHWQEFQMVGNYMSMIIAKVNKEEYEDMMRKYREVGDIKHFGTPLHFTCESKGGAQFPAEVTIEVKVKNTETMFITKIRDLTKQFEQTQALRQRIAFYEEAEEHACCGFFTWDYAENRVYMSDNMLNLFDLNKSDNNCLSDVLTNCLVSTDRKNVAEVIVNAVTNRKRGYEIEFYLRNGKHIRCATVIEYNEKNEVLTIHGACRELNHGR